MKRVLLTPIIMLIFSIGGFLRLWQIQNNFRIFLRDKAELILEYYENQ